MRSKAGNRKLKGAAVAIVLLVLVGFGLEKARNAADGFRNLFNPHYWSARLSGRDLYNPDTRYLKRGPRDRHEVLLTFDDGPHPGSCERILAALKKENVPAAFFVVGRRVKQRPDLVALMIRDGFEVGNHTQDHLRLDKLRPDQVTREIVNCEINVERACGRRTTLLRPPGMRINDAINAQTKALGYTIVGWNVGAKDFIPDQQISDMSAEQSATLQTTSAQIVERVMKQVKDGTIILLHDNPVTAAAVPTIIQRLREQGYGFTSVTRLLAGLPHPVNIVANPTANKLAMASAPRKHAP